MAATGHPTLSPGSSRTYAQISITDSARAQLGDTYYTFNGSVFVTDRDLQALTAPLNVSNAVQGLLIVSANIVDKSNDVASYYHNLHGCTFHAAIVSFRAALQRILPISILSSFSRERAALLPATDFVATISEVVLFFSDVESAIASTVAQCRRSPRHKSRWIFNLIGHCDKWAQRLDGTNEIFDRYIQVLQGWEMSSLLLMIGADDLKTFRLRCAARRTRSPRPRQRQYARHQLLPMFNELSRAPTAHALSQVARSDNVSERTVTDRNYLETSELARLANTVGYASTDAPPNMQALPWNKLAFEEELFRSSVYRRNLHRTQSLSTMTSTFTDHTCSILAHLSLADVSIVSVLRLPISLATLIKKPSHPVGRDAHSSVSYDQLPSGQQFWLDSYDNRFLALDRRPGESYQEREDRLDNHPSAKRMVRIGQREMLGPRKMD